MSSAGHVLDMIKRSRYNDSIRKKRIERMTKVKDIYQEEIRKHHHILFQDKEIDKVKLEEIKSRIRRKIISRRRKAWLLTIALTICIIAAVYFWASYTL